MPWFVAALLGLFFGVMFGVVIGAICAASGDAARAMEQKHYQPQTDTMLDWMP